MLQKGAVDSGSKADLISVGNCGSLGAPDGFQSLEGVGHENVVCIEEDKMAAMAGLDGLIAWDGRAAMVVLVQEKCDRSAAELVELCLFRRRQGSVIHDHDLIGCSQLTGNRPQTLAELFKLLVMTDNDGDGDRGHRLAIQPCLGMNGQLCDVHCVAKLLHGLEQPAAAMVLSGCLK